jgi:hypothetical protein
MLMLKALMFNSKPPHEKKESSNMNHRNGCMIKIQRCKHLIFYDVMDLSLNKTTYCESNDSSSPLSAIEKVIIINIQSKSILKPLKFNLGFPMEHI